MASQSVASVVIDSFSFDSFVIGYHTYMKCWKPFIVEVLPIEREATNLEEQCTVTIKNVGEVLEMSHLT